MAQNDGNVYVIGICGVSCSGKSTASIEIQDLAKNNGIDVTVLSQDSCYKGGNVDTNYDVPDAVDFDLLISLLEALIAGKDVNCPIYDFTTHLPKKEFNVLKPSKIIIVEGILIFYVERLRKLMNLKVFVSALPELCYERRLKRDVEVRGRDPKEVKKRYFNHVLPSSSHYVLPTLQYSDIALINNTDGQFVGLKILLDHIATVL
jgi:uridine kinase